jgi:hypothetical protein
MNRNASIIAMLMLCITAAAFAQNGPEPMTADPQTLLLLQVKNGAPADATGAFQPKARGATVVADKQFGHVLSFGDGDRNGITIPDGGKMNFAKGFTLEAWVFLQGNDQSPNAGGTLAVKRGTFGASISKDGKLDVANFDFPTQKIVTTDKSQLDRYPVGGPHFSGIFNLPQNQWVKLAITYNPDRKVVRSWVNGGIDRTCYLVRTGEQPLQVDPDNPLELFKGMKNFRAGPVRLSSVARHVGDELPMEIYIHQLPYEGKIALQFEHLDPAIHYPVDVAVNWELPPGPNSVIHRIRLDGPASRVLKFTPPSWRNSLAFTINIKAVAGNQQIYARHLVVGNFLADANGRYRINADKILTIDGKKRFPLLMYQVPAEDYRMVGEMGFNILTAEGIPPRVNTPQARHYIQSLLDSAQSAGVYLSMGAKTYGTALGKPGLGIGYIADEPWVTLDKLIVAYNAAKSLDPDVPTLIVQNNLTRMSETAEGTDIIGCDPYPIPRVSLRAVSYATEATVRAVAGLKPVWTVLPQYTLRRDDKRPTLQQLRCMFHLAIISGANGLGVYAWDMRHKDGTGWYTKKDPEAVKILRQAVGEMVKLNDVLLIPNSARKVSFSPANPALHAAVKEGNGKMFLFVANDSRQAETGTIHIAGLADAQAGSLEGGKAIGLHGGEATMTLPPLGVEAYQIKTTNGSVPE